MMCASEELGNDEDALEEMGGCVLLQVGRGRVVWNFGLEMVVVGWLCMGLVGCWLLIAYWFVL